MRKLSYWLNLIIRLQNKIVGAILVALGIGMTIVILLQVFCRFVIYLPVPWSEECARYLMIWTGMMGSVLALTLKRHIGVEIIIKKMGRLGDMITHFLVYPITILFLGIIAQQGMDLALFNVDQESPAMELPMWVPYSAIPLGALMMILVVLSDILNYLLANSESEVENTGMNTEEVK